MAKARILYPTLTRPILVRGVPRDWAILTGFIAPIIYLISGQFLPALWPLIVGLLVGAIMWGIGYALAKYWDPEFMSVIIQKRVNFQRTKGPGKFSGNRYWG